MRHNSEMKLGERLKMARKTAGLSQQALSKKAGVTQSSISEMESGDLKGSTSIASIAKALDVDAFWLETGKGEMQPRGSVPDDLLAIAKSIEKLTKHDQQVVEMIAQSMLAKYDEPPQPPRKRILDEERLHVPELHQKKTG